MLKNSTNNKERLLKNSQGNEFDRLTSSVSDKIESIVEYIVDLQDYEQNLGTKVDTKSFREKMRDKIDLTQKKIKEVLSLLSELEQLDLRTRAELENRNKMTRRLREVFNKEKDKFTLCMKNINAKEKVYIEIARKSMADSIASSSKADELQIQEIDYNEDVINDRQRDIDKVGQVIRILNDINKLQAHEVEKQAENIDVIVDHIGTTKENVKKANQEIRVASKSTKNSMKRNICIFLTVLAIAVMIFVIVIYVKKMR